MDKKEKKQVLEQCYYCGNKGYMDIDAKTSEFVEKEGDLVEHYSFLLAKCPVCERISFIINSTYEGDYDENFNQNYHTSVLYPSTKTKRNDISIPRKIVDSLEVARKIKHIDSASCLIALRRTLEIICKNNGAEKGNLKNKIEYLYENDILPGQLSDASNIIRILGNEGAHGDKLSVNEYYIDQLIDFIELIIEYIYILPVKITQINSSLKNPNVLVFTNKKE